MLTVAAILLAAAAPLRAQSSEANFPTPVFASELSGRIAPRDVGDPRRTRHFYTFRGGEGDLVVNLETTQLIGDVDVFLAAGLRPLIKFTLFGDAARLTKSFYLRKEETLILRVEARAVGDVEGTYRITFGGPFLPAPPELANQTQPDAPTLSSNESRGTRRVTATGARIEEPTPSPTPAEDTAANAEPTPQPTPAPERRTTGRRSNTPRRGRNTRPAPTRSRPTESAAQPESGGETKPPEETANTPETTNTPPPPPAEKPAPTTPARRRGTRSTRRGSTGAGTETGRAAEPPAQPPADTPPAPTQRLIIITKDGEILQRDMSGVRRVTVENNQVVIVGRDGKVTRRPLSDILRMSIEPQ